MPSPRFSVPRPILAVFVSLVLCTWLLGCGGGPDTGDPSARIEIEGGGSSGAFAEQPAWASGDVPADAFPAGTLYASAIATWLPGDTPADAGMADRAASNVLAGTIDRGIANTLWVCLHRWVVRYPEFDPTQPPRPEELHEQLAEAVFARLPDTVQAARRSWYRNPRDGSGWVASMVTISREALYDLMHQVCLAELPPKAEAGELILQAPILLTDIVAAEHELVERRRAAVTE